MKILVISDSHGDISKCKKAVNKNRDANMIIHLGDNYRDALKLISEYPGVWLEYVYGNCDFMIEGADDEKLLELNGKRVLLTHGHKYSVKRGYEKIFKRADELKADILLFGHTHVPEIIECEGFYAVNPGSLGNPRYDSDASYAVIEIERDKIKPRICYV